MEATLAISAMSDLYSQKDSSPSGVSCTFFKINNEWGIKTYRSKEIRDSYYETQKMVAEHGFAPEVGECFEFTIGGEVVYCYITEVAEPLPPARYFELRVKYVAAKETKEEAEEYNDINSKTWNAYSKQIYQTNDAMDYATGWRNHDSHCGNWGLLRGKLVCIDLGND